MSLGPLDRFRLWLAQGLVKAAALPVVAPWVNASFIEPVHRVLVREGYFKNGAVFACISALAFAYPEPPLMVLDEDENPQPKHPLRQLLRRPNPLMGEAELKVYTMVYKAIGGNCYWHKVRSKANRVIELWPYHAGQIKPVPGGPNWIAKYNYDPYGDGRGLDVPVEDIVHFKWPAPDPEQPWQAIPPLRPVARDADTDNELTRYLFALLKNDAIPRMAITLPATAVLDDPTERRLKSQWREKYGGDNRGDVAILPEGATMQRVGLDLKELAFDALHGVPEARIAGAFRVPAIVAGLNIGLSRSTFANFAEARQAFTEQTLVPLWQMDAGEIESALGPDFGGSALVAYDLGNVRALADKETAKWTRVTAAVTAGWLTVNQALTETGFETDPAGDVYLRGMAVEEVPAGVKYLVPAGLSTKRLGAGAAAAKARRDRRKTALTMAKALQRVRTNVAKRMESAVDDYFGELAKRVVARAQKAWPARPVERKELPSVDDLLEPGDGADLVDVVKRFYVEVLSASWETWNTALGVDVAFDLSDPAVTEVLKLAGKKVKGITETTRQALSDLLQYGNEQGWSIDQLVRGTDERAGLRRLIEETYKDRARTIARTELGEAQQTAAVERYAGAGVKEVLVLDNGFDDSDPVCQELGAGGAGTVKSLEWAKANPLQHPNCVRCFAPVFD
ncbi:MAG: phage portal protein [Anaerolineales bacterium]|nr:phage portal protein [Anaerolineales bacterium]